MTKKDDICRCISNEAASINIENIKKNDQNANIAHYSISVSKNQTKNRSL